MTKLEFQDFLNNGIMLVDGAMGTILAQKLELEQPYELAVINSPQIVVDAHIEYINAGAKLIEAFTFGANKIKLKAQGYGDYFESINRSAVQLAKQACNGAVMVFGSMGHCGKPIEPVGMITRAEAYQAFYDQAKILIESGVDGIILESFISFDEIELAITAVKNVSSDIPIIALKAFIEDGETIAEGLPEHFTRFVKKLGVDAAGANCVVGPQRMLDIVRCMAVVEDIAICAMPTPGMPQLVRGKLTYDATPEYYSKYMKRIAEAGAGIIGGCCGTTPEFIQLTAQATRNILSKKEKADTMRVSTIKMDEIPEMPLSSFAESLSKKFVVTVELDLPRGVNLDRIISSAKLLKENGVDAVNISDGARGRLRMHPTAAAHLMQEKSGMEAVVHVACRDRNMLALQADLLSAFVLGIRNLLAITGDPAQIGDYPSATSVFDIDAVGLVRIMNRFNEGSDVAGNKIGAKAGFTIGVAYDPLSDNSDCELERLKKKVDAGAHVIFTQPIYELPIAYKAVENAQKVGLPILIGVLPLRSLRHAEFMHNEVPGISIPKEIRDKFIDCAEQDALKIGTELAQELTKELKKISQGIYIMPPATLPEITLDIISALS